MGASARYFGNRPCCPHARLAQSHRDYTNDGISLETAVFVERTEVDSARCLGTVRTSGGSEPSNETDKQRGNAKPQEANLGQKEAREQKEKKSELSSMGEGSRESSHDLNQKRD